LSLRFFFLPVRLSGLDLDKIKLDWGERWGLEMGW
jgi:hypothetical protein